MKFFISLLIGATVCITFQAYTAYGELEHKLEVAAKTEIADKRLIRSLKNQYNYCLADMKDYHKEKGTTIFEVLCLNTRNCLKGNPSVYPVGIGGS